MRLGFLISLSPNPGAIWWCSCHPQRLKPQITPPAVLGRDNRHYIKGLRLFLIFFWLTKIVGFRQTGFSSSSGSRMCSNLEQDLKRLVSWTLIGYCWILKIYAIVPLNINFLSPEKISECSRFVNNRWFWVNVTTKPQMDGWIDGWMGLLWL